MDLSLMLRNPTEITEEASDVLRVAVDGGEYLGYVEIKSFTTLSNVRSMIQEGIQGIPSNFQFLLVDGVPISPQQEKSRLAVLHLPCVVVRAIRQQLTKDKVSVRFEAETYHTHLTPTYTFGQLRRDAARFFGPAIQNQTTFLTDVSGCVWPEEAMIIDVLDKTRRESENDPLELVLRLRDGQSPIEKNMGITHSGPILNLSSRHTMSDVATPRPILPRHDEISTIQSDDKESVGDISYRKPIISEDVRIDQAERVVLEVMMNDVGGIDVEGELWRIFTHYCLSGSTEIEKLRLRQFKCLLNDTSLLSQNAGVGETGRTLSSEEIAIVYSSVLKTASRGKIKKSTAIVRTDTRGNTIEDNPQGAGAGKMAFSEFISALFAISTKLFADRFMHENKEHDLEHSSVWSEYLPQESSLSPNAMAFIHLLKRYILPGAARFNLTAWLSHSQQILHHSVITLLSRFLQPLLEVFKFYAPHSGQHRGFPETQLWMTIVDFSRFIHDFKLSSLRLSGQEVSEIFLESCYFGYLEAQAMCSFCQRVSSTQSTVSTHEASNIGPVGSFLVQQLRSLLSGIPTGLGSLQLSPTFKSMFLLCLRPQSPKSACQTVNDAHSQSGSFYQNTSESKFGNKIDPPISESIQNVPNWAENDAGSWIGDAFELRNRMRFPQFLAALALIANRGYARAYPELSSELRIKALFQHLSRSLSRAQVVDIINRRRDVNSYAGGLLSASVNFSARFVEMWRADGSVDYLNHSDRVPSGMQEKSNNSNTSNSFYRDEYTHSPTNHLESFNDTVNTGISHSPLPASSSLSASLQLHDLYNLARQTPSAFRPRSKPNEVSILAKQDDGDAESHGQVKKVSTLHKKQVRSSALSEDFAIKEEYSNAPRNRRAISEINRQPTIPALNLVGIQSNQEANSTFRQISSRSTRSTSAILPTTSTTNTTSLQRSSSPVRLPDPTIHSIPTSNSHGMGNRNLSVSSSLSHTKSFAHVQNSAIEMQGLSNEDPQIRPQTVQVQHSQPRASELDSIGTRGSNDERKTESEVKERLRGSDRNQADTIIAVASSIDPVDPIGPIDPIEQDDSHVNPTNVNEIDDMHYHTKLQTGGLFRKHGRRGAPHQRFVWVSSNLDYVHWRPLNKRHHSTKMSMPVADISGVVSGHKTPVFQRLGTPEDERKAFSLVAQNRTLDLEADSEAERNEWVRAFQYLIRHHKQRFPLSLSPDLAESVVQGDALWA